MIGMKECDPYSSLSINNTCRHQYGILPVAGVLGDSTATVIGAMIVAPLMTPIMATAAALIMGNMSRAANGLLLVIVGVAVVLFLSWLWGSLYAGIIVFAENAQITGRVSPRFIDLIAALASGAAGAFCMSRDERSERHSPA